jgi:hypothetical protein
MLFAEFAVNPEQVNSLENLAQLKSSFDFSRGTLISAFPKNWLALLDQRLAGNLSQIQKQRLVALLTTIRDRAVVKSGREYAGFNWVQAAHAINDQKPFYSIVGSDTNAPPRHLTSLEQLELIDFETFGSIDVPRNAQSLIQPVFSLLLASTKIRLVDPFACPTKPSVISVLQALFAVIGTKVCTVEIYSEEAAAQHLVEQHFRQLIRQLPANVRLIWFVLNDGGTGQLHQRLLFNERGGVIFDRGFIEPSAHMQRQANTNLRTMNKVQVDNAARDYNDTQPFVPCVFKLSSTDPAYLTED